MSTDVSSSDHPLDLRAAARDLWPGGTLDFWQSRDAPEPERVYWPETEQEVVTVLDEATASGATIVPYGAGSGVCGGARGGNGKWVLDCKRLDRILGLDEDRRTVDVQAGVNGQHLEDWLNERGFTLGHSPSSIWCSTVGGWAAARGAGQFSSRYGVFEDMVLSMRAVAPGRAPFTVGEGGDAPDGWMELLLGSEGTLAVITELRLRVWPMPEKRWLRGYAVPDVETAVRCMRRLMQAELHPAVVRLYDPVDTKIGGKTKPKSEHGGSNAFFKKWLLSIDALPAVRKRLLTLPLSLPGLVNQVFERAAGGCLLIIGWEGDPEVTDVLAKAGHALLCEEAEDLGPDPGERWFHSRHAVSYKLAPIFERGGFADTMEVAARWSSLVPVYNAVREAVGGSAVVMAHMSHLYPEGGSIYFSFAGRGDKATYEQTWKRAMDAVEATGGTCTHHHGVGRLKAGVASREIGAARIGWERLKSELDPNGLMNPGNVFTDDEAVDAPEVAVLVPEDGMVDVALSADLDGRRVSAAAAGLELQFPWAGDVPPRWQRKRWEIGWTEVHGTVEGRRCWLGRGPRSAAGPDLRAVIAESEDARASFVAVPSGERWLGEGRPDQPWQVARALLRQDLRPAVLTVVEGRLLVGFRGPAARALGELASARVIGGLTEISYEAAPLAGGPLEACAVDDPAAVAVTELDVLRPVEGA